jgi:L-ascorbate metabolism protein UlaG (beta-lactamase superfamily)
MPTTTEKIAVTVRLIGGPTAMIEIGGLRQLTDPTVDSESRIAIGNRTLTKMQPSAVPVDEIGPIDVVLLSHDQPGSTRTARLDGYPTPTSDEAAQAAQIVGAGTVIPVHAEGWAHVTEDIRDLRAAFARHRLIDVSGSSPPEKQPPSNQTHNEGAAPQRCG